MRLLVELVDEKTSKTLKLFIFLGKFLVCLFPINIHNFKPPKTFVSQKQSKKWLEIDKIKIFSGKQTK